MKVNHTPWPDQARIEGTTSPLAGRTIVVTRPQNRTDEVIDAIIRRGGEALICPMIAVQPLPIAEEHRAMLGRLDQFDWLIFTSASAVEMFRLGLEKTTVKELPATMCVITVGDKTAAAVREQGWQVDVIAKHASAEGVVATLLQHGVGHNTKILFPRALEGRETIPQELVKVGAKIVVLPIYQTTPAIPANWEEFRARLLKRKIAAITFTSPSAAHQLFRLLRTEEWPILREVCLAAIGRTTAAAIQERGLEVNVIPERTSAVALIEAIAEYFNS